MNVNTAIGEIGIRAGEREFILRPSFFAMSKLGNPEQIVLTLKVICSAFEHRMGNENIILKNWPLCIFQTCYKIIEACLIKGDAFELCGTISNGRHRERAIPYTDIIAIAFHLMKWGIYGNPSERIKKKSTRSKEMTEFDVTKAVGMMIGQFNYDHDRAWNVTMTEYQSAWEGKYPPTKKEQPMTDTEAKKAVVWSTAVNDSPEVKEKLRLAIAEKYGVQNG